FCGNRGLILSQIDLPPFAAFDAFADLPWRLALARLLVGVQSFTDADAALRAMLPRETIEQTPVPLAAVAMAVAGLLIQYFLDARRQRISILYDDIGERIGTQCGRQWPSGNLRMERG